MGEPLETLLRVGDLKRSVVVINDFFERPDAVLEHALAETYANDGMYPGERSPPMTHTGGPIAKVFERYVAAPILRLESVFQIQPESYEKDSFVHRDFCDWAAVLYLNKGHDGEPGTRFYRHRETGLDRLGRDQPREDGPVFDRFELEKWDVMLTVPIQFNRLVLYDAKLFHRNASAWGTTVRDARLVQSFFIATTAEEAAGI